MASAPRHDDPSAVRSEGSGMSEAKHSPGPWKVCSGQDGKCKCGIMWSIPGDFPICTYAGGSTFPVAVAHKHMADAPDMIYQTIPDAERDANARLISAAPTMLEALKECAAYLGTLPAGGTREPLYLAYCAAEKAIERATGLDPAAAPVAHGNEVSGSSAVKP